MKDIYRAIGISCGKADALDLRARAKDMDGTAIIDEEIKIPQFQNKDYTKYPIGTPVIDNNQVYQLMQPYDASIYTEHPAQARDRWSLCHTKNPAKAKLWTNAFGTSGMYMKNECYKTGNGIIYKAKRDNLIYNATVAPNDWEKITKEKKDEFN